jgi:hypothetical protein
MYFNVIVKDTIIEDINSNQLTFTFYDLDEAINFARNILCESNYHIEILQFEEEED